MTRLDDLDGVATSLEASLEGIRTIVGGLALRAAAAEMERDSARAVSAQSAEELARFDGIVDRLIELAHKATAITQAQS